MKLYKHIEMCVDRKYLCENINEYIKNRKYKNMCNVQKMYIEKMIDFGCFNLYLETYGLHYFLNQYITFNKVFLVMFDRFY